MVGNFAMERAEKKRFLRQVARANNTVIRGVDTDLRYASVSNLAIALALIAAISVGGWLVTSRRSAVGSEQIHAWFNPTPCSDGKVTG